MAQLFEQLVGSDERFEIPVERHLGMVVFRLKGENEMTEKLLKKLNGSGEQEYEFTSKIYFNIFLKILIKFKNIIMYFIFR